MADGELKVDPSDLANKATLIEGIPWGDTAATAAVADPDKLTATTGSVRNLVKNAEALAAEQQWGKVESQRLAETLRLVGQAYQNVDDANRQNIDATIPGGASGPAPAPVPIGTNTTPPPPAPPAMSPFEDVPADEMLDPIETDNKLMEGDQAVALRAAATEWTANAARLSEAALPFEIRIHNWEGAAAEAAYIKFKSFGGWLQALAGKWTQLAAEAEKLATAHEVAKAANAPIRAEYEALQAEVLSGGGLTSSQAKRDRMMQLYQESENIREAYANSGRPTPVQPPQPRPNTVAPTTPVTGNGDPRDRGVPARTEEEEQRGGTSESAPQGAGAGGGQPPQGQGQPQGQPQTPEQPPVSPASATDPAAQAAQQAGQQGGSQGGSPGGGSQGGGAPSGGAPGGGMPGGGMPSTGKGVEPRLPTDPSLKPAAAGGGSGGGGGGGGGVPSSPLQPAVGAETVAPAPGVPGAPIPVASSGSGGGGAMGGGMGGMAPMHGAQGGAGEKKRNPQLSPDEPLYVEDRPHTEQVIGVRPRRRGAPDDTKRGET